MTPTPTPTPIPTPALTPALTVPESNACLKASFTALANGNGRHFKLVSHAALFAFLFHAQRENAACYNEMKCNLHLNTHPHSDTHTHTHPHIQKAAKKNP